jgi:hypothetical protein
VLEPLEGSEHFLVETLRPATPGEHVLPPARLAPVLELDLPAGVMIDETGERHGDAVAVDEVRLRGEKRLDLVVAREERMLHPEVPFVDLRLGAWRGPGTEPRVRELLDEVGEHAMALQDEERQRAVELRELALDVLELRLPLGPQPIGPAAEQVRDPPPGDRDRAGDHGGELRGGDDHLHASVVISTGGRLCRVGRGDLAPRGCAQCARTGSALGAAAVCGTPLRNTMLETIAPMAKIAADQ